MVGFCTFGGTNNLIFCGRDDLIFCGTNDLIFCVRDDEQALLLLLQCGYSVEEALRRKRMNAGD